MIYGRRSTGIWFEVVRGKSVMMAFRPVARGLQRIDILPVVDREPLEEIMSMEPVTAPVSQPTWWDRTRHWATETWQRQRDHWKAGGYGS